MIRSRKFSNYTNSSRCQSFFAVSCQILYRGINQENTKHHVSKTAIHLENAFWQQPSSRLVNENDDNRQAKGKRHIGRVYYRDGMSDYWQTNCQSSLHRPMRQKHCVMRKGDPWQLQELMQKTSCGDPENLVASKLLLSLVPNSLPSLHHSGQSYHRRDLSTNDKLTYLMAPLTLPRHFLSPIDASVVLK